ncbi:UNVERIFIED_CONTAM: hypothetical protein Slati_0855500, partial [Sesamum latifolium]
VLSTVFSPLSEPRLNPSVTWKSIWSSIPLVKTGTHWRIGNDSSCKIWGYPWFPRPFLFKILTLPQVLENKATVNELIDPVNGEWRSHLAESIFWPDEATIILNIPLNRLGGPEYTGLTSHNERLILGQDCFIIISGWQVWRLSTISVEATSTNTDDPEEWFRSVSKKIYRLEFGKVLVICWSLWNAKNKRIMEEGDFATSRLEVPVGPGPGPDRDPPRDSH